MSPATWLGVGAVLLSVAFVLALPGIVEVEPADEVEPIEFGPVPAAGLTGAERAVGPPHPGARRQRAERSAGSASRPELEPPPVVSGDDGPVADDDDGEWQPSGIPDDAGGDDDAGGGDDGVGQPEGDDDDAPPAASPPPPPPPPADDDAGEGDDLDAGEIED